MKKAFVFAVLLSLFAVVSPAQAQEKIVFFTHEGCPYCQEAKAYISKKYPFLAIEYKDIAEPANVKAILKCADTFGLNKRRLGTPLICFGSKNYVYGWSDEESENFDKYVKEFFNGK